MKQELLAPAGDIEAGYAALHYGADAVYLGLQKFSARSAAVNFNEEDLSRFTAFAHHLHRKIYVAVNTLIQESELPELISSLDVCTRCKVDGIILQDLGVARVIRLRYPHFEMHASTQMAVHNREGALFLQSMGFSRVVLARELSLNEIKDICSIPGLETEAFIHGAMCYSYSGLCQFSSLEHGRSANRGKCLYPCRGCFKINGVEKHLFSMKDMALEADVLKMPVTSLKIEGRKKSALYVAAVTDYYRRILDGKGEDSNRADNIRQIFSRPWCKFHFNGRRKDVTDPDFVGHRGLLIGHIEKICHGSLLMCLSHELSRFDGLQIDVPGQEKPFGFAVKNMILNGKKVFTAAKGEKVYIELPQNYPHLQSRFAVYLASSTKVKGSYPYPKPRPNEFKNHDNIEVLVEVSDNKLLAKSCNFSYSLEGDFKSADNPEKVMACFEQAFQKTGDTSFNLSKIEVFNPKGLFVPLSMMNELRRGLYQQIVLPRREGQLPPVSIPRVLPSLPKWSIKTDQIECLKELDLNLFSEIIIQISPKATPSQLNVLPKNKVRLALPTVCRQPQLYQQTIESMLAAGYKKWQVSNYWQINALPYPKLDLSFDAPLYTLNSQAVEMAKEIGASMVSFAIEDTLANISAFNVKSPLKTALIVYQDVPLFISAVCIRHSDCKNCLNSHAPEWVDLAKDGQSYRALSQDCQTMVFDRRPLCLAFEATKIKADYYRMDFVYKPYTAAQVRQIAARLFAFQDIENALKANINNLNI